MNKVLNESKVSQNWRLKLDENENPYGVSPMALAAIKNISSEDISNYCKPQKVLKKLAQLYSLNVENIFLANSRDEILRVVLDLYLEKNDKIAAHEPVVLNTLNDFKDCLKYINREFDVEQCDFSDVKIAYLPTINEVDGNCISARVLRVLAQNFPNTLFILDCSYINFSLNMAIGDYIDLTGELDNVFVLKTFCFEYGLCGLESACLIGSGDNFLKIKNCNHGNLNLASCVALNASLNDEKCFEKMRELNKSTLDDFYEGLLKLGFKPKKSEGNFILCDFSFYRDFYYRKLVNNGVLTKIFDSNSSVNSHIRFTVPKAGGVKYLLELLKEKKVLIFNLDEILKNPDNILLLKNILDNLVRKYDFVFYSQVFDEIQGLKLLKEFEIDKYFCLFKFAKNCGCAELENLKKCIKSKYTAFLSDNIEGSINANKADIQVLGVIDKNLDENYMYNNFKHFGVRYILSNIGNIGDFLDDVFKDDTVD